MAKALSASAFALVIPVDVLVIVDAQIGIERNPRAVFSAAAPSASGDALPVEFEEKVVAAADDLTRRTSRWTNKFDFMGHHRARDARRFDHDAFSVSVNATLSAPRSRIQAHTMSQ